MKKVLLLAVVLLGVTFVFMPVITIGMNLLLNFQGQLTDAAENPVADGNYEIIFSLWDDPSVGTLLWAESLTVPVANGSFSVVLGEETPPQPALFDNQLYMQLQVGTDPPLMPRTVLTSSPYAAMAMAIPGYSPGPDNEVTGVYGFAAGNDNTVMADYGSITGGQMNHVENVNNMSPTFDTTGIFGGAPTTFNSGSFDPDLVCGIGGGWIGGGFLNVALGNLAAVGAGSDNQSIGAFSSIIGGCMNRARGGYDVVAGGYNNETVLGGGWKVISGGYINRINSNWVSTIGGGYSNVIDAPTTAGTIGGGFANRITAHVGTIAGGFVNNATDFGATVGGGQQNTASASYTTVAGGIRNEATGYANVISGGEGNFTIDPHATIGGGFDNSAIDPFTTIGGGDSCEATAYWATVGGGHRNSSTNEFTAIAGGNQNTASGHASNIGGGIENISSDWAATVGGGETNTASGYVSTVGGGIRNAVSGDSAVISGGSDNRNDGEGSVIAGGHKNGIIPGAILSVIGGGTANVASVSGATIAGGASNSVFGVGGSVGGGSANVAGPLGTVPGGEENLASGDNSFAAGTKAKATHTCSYVWADCCNQAGVVGSLPFYSTDDNTYNARATGGFYFVTSCDTIWDPVAPPSGAYLPSGGSMWLSGSDKNLKRNVREVNNSDILDKVSTLPIYQWSYKTQDESIEHIGPMAQDFYKTFEIGDNDKSIGALDPAGICLAAIKQLREENIKLNSEIESLKGEINENKKLSEKVADLTELVNVLVATSNQKMTEEFVSKK